MKMNIGTIALLLLFVGAIAVGALGFASNMVVIAVLAILALIVGIMRIEAKEAVEFIVGMLGVGIGVAVLTLQPVEIVRNIATALIAVLTPIALVAGVKLLWKTLK